jgi:hypothetical protein
VVPVQDRFDELGGRIRAEVTKAVEASYRRAGLAGEFCPDGRTRLKILSPFRAETSPSFRLHLHGDRRGRWDDYGAGPDGGDIIAFVARLHHESMGRATMQLAQVMGLEVPTQATPKLADFRQSLRDQLPSPEIVARLHDNLWKQPGRLDFLRKVRGLGNAMIEDAALGSWCHRVTIPVHSGDRRRALDIRVHRPDGSAGDEMRGWRGQRNGEAGTRSAKLFLPPGWQPPVPGEAVVWTDGELDAPLLADPGFRAIANVCGAGHLPLNGDVEFGGGCA